MKKIYTLAVVAMAGLVFTSDADAQTRQQASPNAGTKHELQRSVEQASQQQLILAKGGSDVFTEDFANGFDGNNTFGAWTIEDVGTITNGDGNSTWHFVDDAGDAYNIDGSIQVYGDDFPEEDLPAGVGIGEPIQSPAGEFSGFAQNTYASESVANGYAIFDADFFNTPVANTIDAYGFLTSPSIDMSAMASVIVEYQQFFRYCCFGASPLTLEVSTDAGDSWTQFQAAGTFVQAANVASANPLTTQVDISCAAAGESDVMIRFAYNSDQDTGYSHYFWALDDIRVFEQPFVNNLEIAEVNNGDIFNFYEYRVTPLDQVPAEGVLSGTIYKNGGNANQEGVTVTVEILDDADVVVATVTSEPFSLVSYANSPICPQDDYDTLLMSTGWTPTEVGLYTMRSTIVSDGIVDESPENNVFEKSIRFTLDEFGHDNNDDIPWDEEQVASEDPDNPGVLDATGYGNIYEFENEDVTCWGVLAAFGDESEQNADFRAALGEIEPDADGAYDINTNLSDLVEGDFNMEPVMISNSITDPTWTYLPFDDEFNEFATTGRYYGYVQSEDDERQMTIYANSNSDTDFSSGEFDRSGAGDIIWFLNDTSTPAVRLIFSERESVDDLADLNNFSVGQNVPNPASTNSFIPFNLEQAMAVTFTFHDVTGKVVKVMNLGSLPAGSSSINFDASEFAPGIYTFTMTADNVSVTKKMIVD